MSMSRMRHCTMWLSFLVLVVGMTASASAQMLSGKDLVNALRDGGYVLLMRHASSPPLTPDKNEAAPGNTTLERQLDDKGKAAAKAMGSAIRSLKIPVGTVLSSPAFRALQTVRIARLGHPRTYEQLGDGGKSMSSSAVAAWASWLQKEVAEMPPAGTNTLIVTQTPNIASAFPHEAQGMSAGEALIFRPDGKGNVRLVARVEVGQWPALAARY
jgi:phosphohistidine phosphatase SixA